MRQFSPPAKYDGILAWHSFFHLNQNDQRAMFPRFAALAASGAALMFTAGHFDGVGDRRVRQRAALPRQPVV
jgi:hypothetical protein